MLRLEEGRQDGLIQLLRLALGLFLYAKDGNLAEKLKKYT